MTVTLLGRRPAAPIGTTSMLIGTALMATGLAAAIAVAQAGLGAAPIAAVLLIDGPDRA